MGFFPDAKKTAAIAVIAVVAVTVASASGLMAPVTRLIGGAVNAVKSAVKGALGLNGNRA